jgi:hypothetical protein
MTDGQPALGWVDKVYREGGKLLSDWTDVPEVVANAIKNKLYKFVSVELLKNVKAHNRVIPWVLDAVALLGADQPAIGNLAELSALMASRRKPISGGTRLLFKRAFTNQSGGFKMDEAQAKAMQDQLDKLTAAQKKSEEENAALRKTITDNEAAQKKALEDARKEKIEARRKTIKDRFEDAVKRTVLLPKHRDSFFATAGVDDDDRVLKIEDKTIDSWLEDNKKAPERGAAQSGAAGSQAEVKASTWAGEVERRAMERVVATGHKADDHDQMVKATQYVLRTDKELAAKYFDTPEGSTSEDAA